MTARLLVLLSATSVASVLAATPARLPSERYARLRTETPFVGATASVAVQPRESWAQNLYLASAAKMRIDGTDHNWVVLRDRTQPGELVQLVDGEAKNGYELLQLEWSRDPSRTKAEVKRGNERGTVEMDRGAFKGGAATGPGADGRNGTNRNQGKDGAAGGGARGRVLRGPGK